MGCRGGERRGARRPVEADALGGGCQMPGPGADVCVDGCVDRCQRTASATVVASAVSPRGGRLLGRVDFPSTMADILLCRYDPVSWALLRLIAYFRLRKPVD